MSIERLSDKIIKCLEKEKYEKVDRILLKNKDNEELFDILLENPSFVNDYLWTSITEEVLQKLALPIQKKLIECKPYLIRLASDELRSEREYMEDLQYRFDTHALEISSFDMENFTVYDYIGSKLVKDKDFIISIQDKSPLTFLKAMKQNLFDDDIIKQFFDKYPDYVSSLPDQFKYDYAYAASLIERIPSDYISLDCGLMDYDYLKNENIKQAIIKVAGEKEYNRTLIHSLASHHEQLKKVSPEEFKRLILLAPDAFMDVDRLQVLFSVGQQRENFNLIQKINKASKLAYKSVNTPQKLSSELFELSSAIGDGLSYETILQQVSHYWTQIEPWISQIDEYHELIDGSYSYTEDPNAFYNIYNLLIGIENNKLEDMFKIFINAELRASSFALGIKNINVTDENLSFLQLACTCNLFNSDEKAIEIYNKIFLRVSSWNSNPYDTLEFIDSLSRSYHLNQLVLNSNIDVMDENLLLNIYDYTISGLDAIFEINSLEEIRDFDSFIDKNLEKFPTRSIEEYKYKMLFQYFQITPAIAKMIIHSYLSADITSSLYKNMPEARYLKGALERILQAGTMEELDKINKSLKNQQRRISFKDIYQVLNNIKRTYGKELNSSFLQVPENNGILDVTNMDFNLLVHVIGAYGAIPSGDIYDSWNTKEKSSTISICTSFISDNNMGIAPTNKHSVILGFNNLPDDFLELMSCHDLYSAGFTASRSSKFLTPNELKDNTRHGHNEVVIRRRKGEFTEEKVEPSYIICFDSVNEESKTASLKFGIPILFIDREKVASRHHDEIVTMLEQFRTILNPHLLSKIICEQENNRAGLRLVRPDLVEKYFSTDFRQQNIEMIYSIIDNGLKNNNPTAIEAMNEFVKAIEIEADKFKITRETPHRKNTYDIQYEEMITTLKSNSAYKEDFELQPELSPEELYEKFIQCRERLSEKEKAELNYINSNELIREEFISSKKVS